MVVCCSTAISNVLLRLRIKRNVTHRIQPIITFDEVFYIKVHALLSLQVLLESDNKGAYSGVTESVL